MTPDMDQVVRWAQESGMKLGRHEGSENFYWEGGEFVPTEKLLRLVALAYEAGARGWQPIETAPKDGTVIDLWADGERLANCLWAGDEWRQQYAEAPGVSFDCDCEPSFWMPLPPSPTTQRYY